jgi:hypothetical protein
MNIEVGGISFPITIDLQNAELKGVIPSELVLRELRAEVDKYDGYMIKDTDFNRWRINDINLQGLTQGGVKVNVSINLKHRELIATVFGKKHFTDWVSITINGTADFAVSIKANQVDVDYRSHDIKGQSWYSDIVEVLANDLFRDKVAKALDSAISQFDGVSITSFLKQGKQIEQGGIKLSLDTLVANTSASANIIPSGVSFVVKLPKELVLT